MKKIYYQWRTWSWDEEGERHGVLNNVRRGCSFVCCCDGGAIWRSLFRCFGSGGAIFLHRGTPRCPQMRYGVLETTWWSQDWRCKPRLCFIIEAECGLEDVLWNNCIFEKKVGANSVLFIRLLKTSAGLLTVKRNFLIWGIIHLVD